MVSRVTTASSISWSIMVLDLRSTQFATLDGGYHIHKHDSSGDTHTQSHRQSSKSVALEVTDPTRRTDGVEAQVLSVQIRRHLLHLRSDFTDRVDHNVVSG